jgi:hypothetical protein
LYQIFTSEKYFISEHNPKGIIGLLPNTTKLIEIYIDDNDFTKNQSQKI